MRAGAAALLAAMLPLGCSGILGIHDIGGPDDGGATDGSGPRDGTTGDASPDAHVGMDATHDAGADTLLDAPGAEADVTVDSPPPTCTMDAGGEVVAVEGCPCSSVGAGACTGVGQTGLLLCGANGLWAASGACGSGTVCDPNPGSQQGTCVAIDPLCTGMSAGALVCSDDVTVARCSDDLLSHSTVSTCTGQACIAGVCTGVCTPDNVQSCSGPNHVIQCGTNGQWSTLLCSEPNPDCGPFTRGGQGLLGCTCYGRRVGTHCVDPVELTPAILPGWHVAVDATSVYWDDMGTQSCDGGTCTYNGDARIYSTPLGGGSTTFLQGFLPPSTLFRVNAAGVYWEAPACPGDGGPCTQTLSTRGFDAGAPTVVGATPGATDFALDSNAAYVVEPGVGLVRVPLDGSTQTTLAASTSPQHVAIDAANAYFTDFGGSIWSVALGGGGPALVTTTKEPNTIAVDSSNLYWEDATCPDGGACWLLLGMPLGGATAISLTTPAAPSDLEPWGGNVYFTDGTAILSVPATGGSMSIIAAPLGGVHDIAVDATSVYWADMSGYGVWKISHP
jgi:hypothetical protein